MATLRWYQVEVHECQLVNVRGTSKNDAVKRVLAGEGEKIDGGFDFKVCGGSRAVRELDK